MKYELKEAIIVRPRSISTTGPGSQINNGYALGNQFQVRVLPEMNDIEETDLLPYYANFFKADQTAYQKDDRVWLFCTEDFQAGFILGLGTGVSGMTLTPFIQAINVAEANAGLQRSGFNEVTIEGASGTSIRFANEINGQSGVIYNNKSVYLYGPNGEIWVNNPGMKMYVNPDGDAFLEGKSTTEKYSADATTTVGGESKETSGSKRIETSGMITISAGGSRQEIVGANKTESVLGDSQNVVGGKYSILAGPAGLTLTTLGIMNIEAPVINVISPLLNTPPGFVAPTGTGGLCALPVCLFATGTPHVGTTLVGV